MDFDIKELRESTGMTQSAFAKAYNIPLSTLRKWEQHEASPAAYVKSLIARTIPCTDDKLRKIAGKKDTCFYYDKNQGIVYDMRGNSIYVHEDLEGVKEQNLTLYLTELFDSFYEIQNKFNNDCKYDKEEDILWV